MKTYENDSGLKPFCSSCNCLGDFVPVHQFFTLCDFKEVIKKIYILKF